MPSIAEHAPIESAQPGARVLQAARSLLAQLSDAELARYGEIAHDQAKGEWNRWRVGISLLIAASAVFGISVWHWGLPGITRLVAENSGLQATLVTALGAVLYLLYRRLKNWKLWNRHCQAVRDEQKRRVFSPQRG